MLAVSAQRIHVGSNDDFAVRAYDHNGALRAVVRRAMKPRAAGRTELRDWIDQWIEAASMPPDERAEIGARMSQLQFADEMPAFRSLAVDSEGNLWVEEWEGVGVEQGRFSVFRPDGAWLGYVDVPDGLSGDRIAFNEQQVEIGSDYFLGVWSDQYEVEQVRLYRIEKPTR